MRFLFGSRNIAGGSDKATTQIGLPSSKRVPIVFNLLPEKFSLRELQNLYEAILGVKMDRRNFRKKFFLMDWLEDMNELEQDVPHRPGKLYRFNSGRFSNGKTKTSTPSPMSV